MKQHRFANADQQLSLNDALSAPCVIQDEVFQRLASTSADVGLLIQSMDGRILWANDAYAKMMMLPKDQIIGRNPLSFALSPINTPSETEIAQFRFDPLPRGQSQITIYENKRGENNEVFWVELHSSFDKIREHGDVAIVVARDITDHITRQKELTNVTAKLSRLAASDSLTGLFNRHSIMEKIAQALAVSRQNGSGVGLLEIDLDHFKSINDSFGHAAGDAVLSKIANTLRQFLPHGATAARIGGDEFLVLYPNAKSLAELETLGHKIVAQNEDALYLDGTALRCGISVGAAFTKAGDLSPEDLLKRADFALYEAKKGGRGHVVPYDKTLHERQVAEARLAEDLQCAVENGDIAFHFQPVMECETGLTKGFETLVRWHNPRLGMISPVDFLPLAKSLGLMAKIDFAALRAALDLKVTLNANGFGDVRLGLNGSAELLGHPAFFDTIISELKSRNLSPSDVLIEVLETVVFEDISKSNPLVQTVQRLHDAGIAILLDDFGTGHAGLTHLAALAVSGVKIDRSLTQNILTDPTSAKIIAMVFELCQDLGLHTVTEGVETPEQADMVATMGGAMMQGYWFAPAMPASEVLDWLACRKGISG